MPFTSPVFPMERYNEDVEHFDHVLEYLFKPVLEEAGFAPIFPKTEALNIIQTDIIKQLSGCELVLCDISILNPNVFLNLG